MVKIAPSILAADFNRLGEEIKAVENAGADYLHIDVMDGHFVPNISFGAGVMKSLNKLDVAPYDVHLMIESPEKYIADFVTEKTEFITIHQEADRHLNRTINYIKSLGVKAGVSINPGTPVESLSEILDIVDIILVMSVNPGFGGQKFIESSYDKIRRLASMRKSRDCDFLIEVDGGVNSANIVNLKEAGVDIFVAGSEVFGAENIPEKVKELKSLIE